MKYDIFISYSRKDIEFARKVCAVLDSYKQYYDFEYFFDQSEITRGDEYYKRISSAISDSRVVLFLASQNSYDSEFCAKELLFADNKNKSIHQYRIDKADVPQMLEMLLIMHQCRELSTTPIECEVSEVLKEVLGGNVLSLEELKATETQPKREDHDVQPKIEKKNKSSNHHRNGGWLKRPAIWLSAVAVVVVAMLMMVLGKSSDDERYYSVGDFYNERYYSVGDFYDDGTKQGVVFEVSRDGKHGKIVSLNQEYLAWCTDEQYDKYIQLGADSGTDGWINTNIVMHRGDDAEYPAFKWCREQGDEWYLPSRDELLVLYRVKDFVNRTLAKYSYKEIKSAYWSSTEISESCAWSVRTRDGGTNRSYKTNGFNVRAVSAF